jgi:hypothetical protein
LTRSLADFAKVVGLGLARTRAFTSWLEYFTKKTATDRDPLNIPELLTNPEAFVEDSGDLYQAD